MSRWDEYKNERVICLKKRIKTLKKQIFQFSEDIRMFRKWPTAGSSLTLLGSNMEFDALTLLNSNRSDELENARQELKNLIS